MNKFKTLQERKEEKDRLAKRPRCLMCKTAPVIQATHYRFCDTCNTLRVQRKELNRSIKHNYYNRDKARQKYIENKEYYIENARRWRTANPDRYNKIRKRWLHKDPLSNIKQRIRSRMQDIRRALRLNKSIATEAALGCTFSELIRYLESTWRVNYPDIKLSWDKNIHIDHIIPLHLAQTEEDLINLSHYMNLQLLTAGDNRSKHGKLLVNISEFEKVS